MLFFARLHANKASGGCSACTIQIIIQCQARGSPKYHCTFFGGKGNSVSNFCTSKGAKVQKKNERCEKCSFKVIP